MTEYKFRENLKLFKSKQYIEVIGRDVQQNMFFLEHHLNIISYHQTKLKTLVILRPRTKVYLILVWLKLKQGQNHPISSIIERLKSP